MPSLPITVVIPARDRSSLIPRAIRSVLSQIWQAAEIIVVDDGSVDATCRVVRSHFPQVRCLSQPASGVSRARNLGIAKARYPWIALLDSDDLWLPGKLAKQWQALQGNPHWLVHTDEIWIRRGKRVNQPQKQRLARSGGRVFRNNLSLCAISPSSALFHKRLWWQAGGFDERLPACEDYDFWLRITARHAVLYVDEPLIVKYGGHPDQLSRKYPGMDRFRIHALLKVLQTVPLQLQPDDRLAALAVLLEKAHIYAQGALKRDKTEEAKHYQRLCRLTLRQLQWWSHWKPKPDP